MIVILLALVQRLFSFDFKSNEFQITSVEAGFENIKPRITLRAAFFILVALFVITLKAHSLGLWIVLNYSDVIECGKPKQCMINKM